MLFSSIPFLYYFFPFVFFLYAIVPAKLKNIVLLLTSLFFYGWGGIDHLLLMIASIFLGYAAALLIDLSKSKSQKKLFLVLYLILCLGILGYYKYTDFFISNINALTGMEIPLLNKALPIGISFFTFQILSYVADVYRKDAKVQYNPFTLATYVSMFPQLIAGPIVRYVDVEKELAHRTHTLDNTIIGIRRFVIGLSKKILIANALGELCDIFKASQEKSVAFYWIYAVGFMLHIYYDFSGYSDMAIGIGKIFGFQFLENFDYPYSSKSITEFWRRWHMSLGSWFRDYVYIPLGGNRVSKVRWIFNIFVVWFLTGFWHGASWNFIVWGLYFAVLLMFEKLWFLKKLPKLGVFQHIYVLFFVNISFVIFNAANMPEAVSYIKAMFGAGNIPLISAEALYYGKSYFVVLLIAMIGSVPLCKNGIAYLRTKPLYNTIIEILEPWILIGMLILCTAYLVDGSFNPFLYFRF